MPQKDPSKAPVGPRPATFDHLKKKKPMERTVPIVLSDEPLRAHQAASEALERAKLTGAPTADLEAAVAKAQAELDAETVIVRLRCIGRKAYDALVRAHPPTDEQVSEHKERFGAAAPYDAETFSIALIAASAVEPAMSDEQVAELAAEWSSAEYLELWSAALEVNTQRRVLESGKAYG